MPKKKLKMYLYHRVNGQVYKSKEPVEFILLPKGEKGIKWLKVEQDAPESDTLYLHKS